MLRGFIFFLSIILSCVAFGQTTDSLSVDSVPAKKLNSIRMIKYCPDTLMAKYVSLFKECDCYKNDNYKRTTSVLGLRVLNTGYDMSVNKKQIVRGSCWQFVNEVYNQAGFTNEKRKIVFQGSKAGVFADSKMLEPGDWVYHVNHSFNNVEHSAIFICWKNFEKRTAIMLGYVGQNLPKPGYYGEFDMRSVYYITRPKQP
jgi:hypothetical protein